MRAHGSAFGHADRVFDVQFSPADSSLLATASEDTTVRMWRCSSTQHGGQQQQQQQLQSGAAAAAGGGAGYKQVGFARQAGGGPSSPLARVACTGPQGAHAFYLDPVLARTIGRRGGEAAVRADVGLCMCLRVPASLCPLMV